MLLTSREVFLGFLPRFIPCGVVAWFGCRRASLPLPLSPIVPSGVVYWVGFRRGLLLVFVSSCLSGVLDWVGFRREFFFSLLHHGIHIRFGMVGVFRGPSCDFSLGLGHYVWFCHSFFSVLFFLRLLVFSF